MVLLSRFPFPLEKGDKLRAFYQIKELAAHHEIHLIAVSDAPVSEEQLEELKPFCHSISVHRFTKRQLAGNLFRAWRNGWPFQVGYFYHPVVQRKIDAAIERIKPEAIYAQLIRTAEYVRNVKHIPTTLDYMDVFSQGMARRLETESFPKKIAVRMEYNRLMRYEAAIFDDFGAKTIISQQDRDLIPHPKHNEIAVIPNGVDYGFFRPLDRPKTFDLLFAGNMAYPPNVESVTFIVKEVLPLIWKKRPETNFVIAGATPAPEIKAMEGPKITVTGWVDDIREQFAASKIMLAPMLISIGMQNKILQAMAMKIPCIVTSLANNAIAAPPGKAIIVAETAAEFADQVLKLLDAPDEAEQIAAEGMRFVCKTYDWEITGRQLSKIICRK